MVCCHVPHFTIQKTETSVDRVDRLTPSWSSWSQCHHQAWCHPESGAVLSTSPYSQQTAHLLSEKNTDPTGPLVWLNVHRSALDVQLSDVLSLSRQSIQFSRKCDTIFHTASLTRGFIAKVRDFWDHETFRLLTKVFGVKKHDETLRVIPRSSDSNIKQKLTSLQVLD